MDATARRVRKYVFDHFLEMSTAPVVAEIASDLDLPLTEVKAALGRLEDGHQLKLLDGTDRILMAFPFSAIPSPFRVTRPNGKRYFANCAWDALAFHPMLREPLRIDSFCDRCGKSLHLRAEDGHGVAVGDRLPAVHLKLPAAQWWTDITRTCSNTMVFLGPEEVEAGDQDRQVDRSPGVLTVDQVLAISIPIYRGKMDLAYDRPPVAEIQEAYRCAGLVGPYWQL